MAHHGENPLGLCRLDSTPQAGPTGRFPHGKIDPKDGGEIAIRIATTEQAIVLEFGKPIAWIGFTPEQANLLAGKLIAWADSVSRVADFATQIQNMSARLKEEKAKLEKALSGHSGAGIDMGGV